MADDKGQNGRGFWQTLLGRERSLVEIDGHRAGDLEEECPVHLLPGAAFAGNLTAPEVVVSGLLYGDVIARRVSVEAGGQIWGNVHATTVEIAREAQVHGWIQTIDDAAYRRLRENGATPPARIAPEPSDLLPPELAVDGERGDDGPQPALLALLQEEAGAALAARAELEAAFEERVSEVAGDARAQVRTLTAELDEARRELAALEARLEDRGRMLAGREEQLESRAEELERARALLAERATALAETEAALENQRARLARTDSHNQSLEDRLNESMTRIDTLTGRMESLESALQSSVQHSAEQEEALIHWQELAEVTQKQVGELEQALAESRRQTEAQEQLAEQVRAQRRKAEQAWADALEELESVRAELEAGLDQPGPAAELLEAAQAEASRLEAERATAMTHISRLEAELAQAHQTLQEEEGGSGWYKASLQATREALDYLRRQQADTSRQLQEVQGHAEENRRLAEEWKGNVGRLSQLLYEAEKRVKEKERHLQEVRADLKQALSQTTVLDESEVEALESLRQTIRQRDVHIEALEEEIDGLYRQITSQGERLAEARVELVEGQMRLQASNEELRARTEEAQKIRRLATRRIRKLEAELDDTRRKLQDLMAWVERHRRRDVAGN